MIYDLAIIGGGPAGVAAGIYASRKQLKTIFIAEKIGGQSVVSESIQNWIGTVSIPGAKLAQDLEKHLRAYAGDSVEIKTGATADLVEKKGKNFVVKTGSSEYEAKTVLIATGSRRRKLTIPGAAEFENKGITYCASCDGPLFSGMDVAVIGGGNAGFESASQLLAYCKSVTLLEASSEFRADPVTVEKLLANPKMKAVSGVKLLEFKGDKFLKSLAYEKSGKKSELKVQGVFVEIGHMPATDLVKDIVKTNKAGQIIADPRTQQTSQKGIWAAGDCTDVLYHQNNIAVGDAVKAAEDIYNYIKG